MWTRLLPPPWGTRLCRTQRDSSLQPKLVLTLAKAAGSLHGRLRLALHVPIVPKVPAACHLQAAVAWALVPGVGHGGI